MSGTDSSNGDGGRDEQGGDEGRNGQGEQNGRDNEPGTAEKAVMALSVAVTVLLFAYAGSQALGAPVSAQPEAAVIGTERLSNESVAVKVQIHNPRDVGLITATVESECTSPPADVQFSYLPADSKRTGTLVCPANTTSPNVSVSSWIEA